MKHRKAYSHICKSKAYFKTLSIAKNRSYELKREGVLMNVYKCNFCDGYHLTSKNDAEMKSSRKRASKLQKKFDEIYKKEIEKEAEYWIKKKGWK